jgi:hypothetical protein
MIASTTSVSLELTTLCAPDPRPRSSLSEEMSTTIALALVATANCTVDDVAVAPAARYMRTDDRVNSGAAAMTRNATPVLPPRRHRHVAGRASAPSLRRPDDGYARGVDGRGVRDEAARRACRLRDRLPSRTNSNSTSSCSAGSSCSTPHATRPGEYVDREYPWDGTRDEPAGRVSAWLAVLWQRAEDPAGERAAELAEHSVVSWFAQNKDFVAIVIAWLALLVSLGTVLVQRRQQQLEAYRRICDILLSPDIHRGRWALIDVGRTRKIPRVGVARALPHCSARSVNCALATYYRHRIVPVA